MIEDKPSKPVTLYSVVLLESDAGKRVLFKKGLRSQHATRLAETVFKNQIPPCKAVLVLHQSSGNIYKRIP